MRSDQSIGLSDSIEPRDHTNKGHIGSIPVCPVRRLEYICPPPGGRHYHGEREALGMVRGGERCELGVSLNTA